MFSLFGRCYLFFSRFRRKCIQAYFVKRFKHSGSRIYISEGCSFTPKTISVGNDVYFGKYCIIHSVHGEIQIGNHVMFGPGVHIHGGNHITNSIGTYMDSIKKESNSDGIVAIEDDVWIGANSIILKGVTIHQGAVIGAGSVVTKDVEPYSIVVGNPARKIKDRFAEDELIKHKDILLKNYGDK